MKRTQAFALVLLVLGGAAQGQPAGWPEINLMGWVVASDGPDILLLLRDALPKGSHRVWVRVEYKVTKYDGNFAYRSTTSLDEANCGDQSYKQLQQTLYTKPNLDGEQYEIPGNATRHYAMPGTFGEVTINAACDAAANR